MTLSSAAGISCLCMLSLILCWVRRLYDGRIARFPGPKVAALTGLYELYFDGILETGYAEKLRELHKRYGPIIRIGPNEVHINDPELYKKLSLLRGLDKDAWYYNVGAAIVTTPSCEEHRQQRRAVSSLFHPASIHNFESIVLENVGNLRRRLGSTSQSANLSDACRSLTNDIVTQVYFGSSNQLLAEEDFATEFHRACGGFLRLLAFIRQFGFVGYILTAVSYWYSRVLRPAPKLRSILQYQQNIGKLVDEAIRNHSSLSKQVLLHKYLDSPLPERFKSPARLHSETLGAIIAGTEATANVLITAFFYLLSNVDCLARLQQEVDAAWPETMGSDLAAILQLPYLASIPTGWWSLSMLLTYFSELRSAGSLQVRGCPPEISTEPGLALTVRRLEEGSVFRKPMISRTDIELGELTLPAGVVFSFTPKLIHENEVAFPQPEVFNPQRWGGANSKALKRYLGTFAKGDRSCLGQHMAHRIVMATLACVIHDFHLCFHGFDETLGRRDGLLRLFPPKRSRGLRVVVKDRDSKLQAK